MQVIQSFKLVEAVLISSILIKSSLVVLCSFCIALRLMCPNLLCAKSIVLLLTTIVSLLELLLELLAVFLISLYSSIVISCSSSSSIEFRTISSLFL